LTTEQQKALDETADSIFVYVDNLFIIKKIYDSVDPTQQTGIAMKMLNSMIFIRLFYLIYIRRIIRLKHNR